MNEPIKLSLEQEFYLRSFADDVEKMTREQALEYLIYLYLFYQKKTLASRDGMNFEQGFAVYILDTKSS